MRCANCDAENREQARFCRDCGEALLEGCPRCGGFIPIVAKHCDLCGLATAPAKDLGQGEPDTQDEPSAPHVKRPLPDPHPATLVPRWDSSAYPAEAPSSETPSLEAPSSELPVRTIRFSGPRSAESGDPLRGPDRTDEIDLSQIRRGRTQSDLARPAIAASSLALSTDAENNGSSRDRRVDPELERQTVPTARAKGGDKDVQLRLEAVWGDVVNGLMPRVAVVRGPAGIGKSHAIDGFVASAAEASVFAPAGRALPLALELTGWLSVLEALSCDPKKLQLPGELGAPMQSAVKAALAGLLNGSLHPDPSLVSPLAEGLATALLAGSRKRPCVLMLDYEGALTRPLCAALMRASQERAPQLLTLVEKRSGPNDVGEAPACHLLIEMAPLSSRHLRELANREAPTIGEVMSTKTLEHLGGNPRALKHLLHGLGPLSRPRGDQVAQLAEDADLALYALVEKMPPMVRSIGARAALLGEASTVSDLIAVCDDVAGPEGVRAALTTLTGWGLVEVIAAGVPVLRFCDARTQQHLQLSLPEPQRLVINERIKALLVSNAPAALNPVALNPDAATLSTQDPDTLEQPAATLRLELAAVKIDEGHLDEATDLLQEIEKNALAGLRFAEVAAVATLRGQLALKRGQLPQARMMLEESLGLTLSLGDRQAEASARAALVRVHVRLGEITGAESELARLRALTTDDVWVNQLGSEITLARKANAYLSVG